MTALQTLRLDLVPLSPPLVAALVARDVDAARQIAPFALDPTTFADDEHVLALRHLQLTRDPSEEPWLLHAAILREAGTVLGKVGFHAPPAADGIVEIGYRVAPPYRKRGFATEMAVAMIAWAASHGASACLASVRPDNIASLRLIDRIGFERTGEQIDDIDGLEWVFTLPLTALPSYETPR